MINYKLNWIERDIIILLFYCISEVACVTVSVSMKLRVMSVAYDA